MGQYYAQNPSPPHFYSQSLQLKLYQAFIFSIPILFSIILFLLFYLFYLKRRANSALSSPHPMPPGTSNPDAPFVPSPFEVGLKGDLKDKLPVILFTEELRARSGPICCVCLGEFEMKEELHQVPSCKHVFHVDCLHQWLHSNSTCPLCRCLVIPSTKLTNNPTLGPLDLLLQETHNSNHQTHIIVPSEQLQQVEEVGADLNPVHDPAEECRSLQVEESSSANSRLEEPHGVNESVAIQIGRH